MLRVVLDTNLIVAAAYNPNSASARIVAGCLAGRLVPVVSPPLRGEYEYILPRSIRVPGWRDWFADLMARASVVEPATIPRVVEGDPADDMLFATARAGDAVALLTNDRLLLPLDDPQEIRVLQPRSFLEAGFLDDTPGDVESLPESP